MSRGVRPKLTFHGKSNVTFRIVLPSIWVDIVDGKIQIIIFFIRCCLCVYIRRPKMPVLFPLFVEKRKKNIFRNIKIYIIVKLQTFPAVWNLHHLSPKSIYKSIPIAVTSEINLSTKRLIVIMGYSGLFLAISFCSWKMQYGDLMPDVANSYLWKINFRMGRKSYYNGACLLFVSSHDHYALPILHIIDYCVLIAWKVGERH